MKVTTKKCVNHNEIVFVEETYEVRVQITKGNIITVRVEIEDESIDWWEGKTTEDKEVLNKLGQDKRQQITDLLNELTYE